MALSISNIRSGLALGGARPTLFKVDLTFPPGVGVVNDSSLLIRAASIPESTINPIEVPYMGRKIRVAGDRTFDVWNVTVMNDESFNVRNTVENWHNQINSLLTNLNKFGTSAPSRYKANAYVTQLSKTGESLRRYKFNGLFPIQVSSIDLDWEATDQIENFNVTFAYDWYEIDGKTGIINGV